MGAVGWIVLIVLGGVLMMQARMYSPMFGPNPDGFTGGKSMLISSGTTAVTTAEVLTANGCWIDKATKVVVLGIASASAPLVYLCETLDEFEPEEFCCFADNIELMT